MKAIKYWIEGNSIFCQYDSGLIEKAADNWRKGCQVCGAYRNEIRRIAKNDGQLDAYLFARESLLTHDSDGCESWCCIECLGKKQRNK